MDIDKLQQLSDRVASQLLLPTVKQKSGTDRTTDSARCSENSVKQTCILPFFDAVGYDIFNSAAVAPEFPAGFDSAEKVDYALLFNGLPKIIVECKAFSRTPLTGYIQQLRRYFAALIGKSVKLAILTNGRSYEFYSDFEIPNSLDVNPFHSMDIAELLPVDRLFLERLQPKMFERMRSRGEWRDFLTLKPGSDNTGTATQEIEDPVLILARQHADSLVAESTKIHDYRVSLAISVFCSLSDVAWSKDFALTALRYSTAAVNGTSTSLAAGSMPMRTAESLAAEHALRLLRQWIIASRSAFVAPVALGSKAAVFGHWKDNERILLTVPAFAKFLKDHKMQDQRASLCAEWIAAGILIPDKYGYRLGLHKINRMSYRCLNFSWDKLFMKDSDGEYILSESAVRTVDARRDVPERVCITSVSPSLVEPRRSIENLTKQDQLQLQHSPQQPRKDLGLRL